jgi:hypothetical protein
MIKSGEKFFWQNLNMSFSSPIKKNYILIAQLVDALFYNTEGRGFDYQ